MTSKEFPARTLLFVGLEIGPRAGPIYFLRLRAMRRMGPLLKEMEKSGEREGKGGDRKSKSSSRTLKLDDLGISKNLSATSRERIEITVPEKNREEGEDETRDQSHDPVTLISDLAVSKNLLPRLTYLLFSQTLVEQERRVKYGD